MSLQLLEKMNNIVESLLIQADHLDNGNRNNKTFNLRRDNTLFSETLFSTNSAYLSPYVLETQKKLTELSKLLKSNKREFSFQRIQLIEQQISAIISAINANESQNKGSKQQLDAIKARRFKKAAASLIESSKHLHQQLAETKEFERRLQQMLDDKQIELSNSLLRNRDKLSAEMLVLHQRLGRCRQAISKIERKIEMSEKR